MKIDGLGPQMGMPKGPSAAGAPDKKGEGPAMPKEAVGDLANRIATNSSTKPTRAVTGKGNPNLDRDAFFKLMMTQVQSQDPTNPLKSHEMSAQLAQFSSLEQMSNIHSVLNDMKKAQGHDSQYQALDMIGKVISGDNGKIERMSGDQKHDLSFVINDTASEMKVAITDAKGKVVKTFDMNNQAKGNVAINWDGKDTDGNILPPGNYKMSAEAKTLQGNKLSVDTKFKGTVTGVQFTERGPVVMIGNKTIPFKDIKQIEVDGEKNASMMGLAAAAMKAGPPPMAGAPGAGLPGAPNMGAGQPAKNPILALGSEGVMPQMQLPLNLNQKI